MVAHLCYRYYSYFSSVIILFIFWKILTILTLLFVQFWIYAHFPSLGCSAAEDPALHGAPRWATRLSVPRTPVQTLERLRSLRTQLDQMRAEDIKFMPYGDRVLDFQGEFRLSTYRGTIRIGDIVEPYMPDRVLRQFGFVQTIPQERIVPYLEVRPETGKGYKVRFHSVEDRWESRHDATSRVSLAGRIPAPDPWTVSADYMDWFSSRCHPFVLPSSAVQIPSPERPLQFQFQILGYVIIKCSL